MKKIYVLFLLLLSLFYTENVMAYDFCVDNIYYNVLSIEDLTAEVTFGETGYEGKVIIPSTVLYKGRDLSIRSIGRAAFSDCNITEIELPKSIEKIDEYAFADCRFLKSFSVKSSVLIIGSGAFSSCKALKSFIVEDSEEVLVFEDYS